MGFLKEISQSLSVIYLDEVSQISLRFVPDCRIGVQIDKSVNTLDGDWRDPPLGGVINEPITHVTVHVIRDDCTMAGAICERPDQENRLRPCRRDA